MAALLIAVTRRYLMNGAEAINIGYSRRGKRKHLRRYLFSLAISRGRSLCYYFRQIFNAAPESSSAFV